MDPMRAELTRRTTGLSPAHRELIRLLAQRAVEDFLREGNMADVPDEREEVTR
jgi:hypothetical protein